MIQPTVSEPDARLKRQQLKRLVAKRRADEAGRPATGYSRIYRKLGEFHGGRYDCADWVVPWSITANNVNSEIMLIAQDWASEEFLSRPFDERQAKLGYHPDLPTNKNLFQLLSEYTNRQFCEVFATDVFPFAKPGSMTASLPQRDLVAAALQFAIPQIEIIRPRLVICIGSATYNAIRRATGRSYISIRESLTEPTFNIGCSCVVAVTHTGGLGVAAAGGRSGIVKQWARIRRILDTEL